MSNTLAKALTQLYPTAVPGEDYRLRDDGSGPVISVWNLPGPQPTADQITAAAATYDAAQTQRETRRAARRQRILAATTTAAGKDPLATGTGAFSAAERIAVQALIWERLGILDDDGKLLPPDQWP